MRQPPKVRNKTRKRYVQRVLTTNNKIGLRAEDHFLESFHVALRTTKNWTLSTDFRNNVNQALERERQS